MSALTLIVPAAGPAAPPPPDRLVETLDGWLGSLAESAAALRRLVYEAAAADASPVALSRVLVGVVDADRRLAELADLLTPPRPAAA